MAARIINLRDEGWVGGWHARFPRPMHPRLFRVWFAYSITGFAPAERSTLLCIEEQMLECRVTHPADCNTRGDDDEAGGGDGDGRCASGSGGHNVSPSSASTSLPPPRPPPTTPFVLQSCCSFRVHPTTGDGEADSRRKSHAHAATCESRSPRSPAAPPPPPPSAARLLWCRTASTARWITPANPAALRDSSSDATLPACTSPASTRPATSAPSEAAASSAAAAASSSRSFTYFVSVAMQASLSCRAAVSSSISACRRRTSAETPLASSELQLGIESRVCGERRQSKQGRQATPTRSPPTKKKKKKD